MTNNYARAYTEVLEILSHFSKEEYSKIPKEKITYYNENSDKDYIYTINPEIDLYAQYISNEANAILVSLFRDYFATIEQKETLDNLLNKNQKELNERKAERYNPYNIFNREKLHKNDKNTKDNTMKIVECKESFFDKFVNFVKRWLNKNNE